MTRQTGVVTDEVVYMTADVEDEYVVAQANEPLDENDRFVNANASAPAAGMRSWRSSGKRSDLHGRLSPRWWFPWPPP